MILLSYSEIIELLHYNLAQRLDDYKNYHCNLDLQIINQNAYIITNPEYNIFDEDKYTEPNRFEKINDLIYSMPHFNNLFEFIELVKTDEFKYIETSLFSKGIDRLETLANVIYHGRIDSNMFTNTDETNFKPLNGWNESEYNDKIKIISSLIAFNQVFSDCNHRMSYYILEKYLSDGETDLLDFINFIKSKNMFYAYGSLGWVQIMNSIYKII